MTKIRISSQKRDRLEEAKRLLVGISAREFVKKGYDRTNMHDLARAFGLTKSGMYHYIGSKGEILNEIINRIASPVSLAEMRTAVTGLGGTQAITAAIETYIKYIDNNRHYYRFINHVMILLTKAQRQTVMNSVLSKLELLKGFIRSGISTGEFQTQYPEFVAYLIIIQAQAWATMRWQLRYEVTVDSYIRMVTENVMKMLESKHD